MHRVVEAICSYLYDKIRYKDSMPLDRWLLMVFCKFEHTLRSEYDHRLYG